ncbi:MAG: general secretion pathway protein GspB [Candidatus Omnitrophica bacterium]|nr:general secretion pathway protein GspB [Candidatus Omnitrophota bacterium]
MSGSVLKTVLTAAVVLPLFIQGSVWASYDPKGKRDPFVQLITADGQRIFPPGLDEEDFVPTTTTDLVLQGILFDPASESFAVINGEVLKEQEEFDGIKVLKIEPDIVTLMVNGQISQLALNPEIEEETEE